MITRIHVNGANLRMNKKDGRRRPVFTIKDRFKGKYRNRKTNGPVYFAGGRLLYCPHNPLSSGAVAWFETEGEVVSR